MTLFAEKLERNLGWIVALVLLGGCLLVLRPFVSALLWAVVLCFSSWPIYRRLLRLLCNRRTLAALLMTLAMVLIVLLPFLIVVPTLTDNVKELTTAARRWTEEGPPIHPHGWSRCRSSDKRRPTTGRAWRQTPRSYGRKPGASSNR
jgi:predicted PurR-regulated permease PerM